VHATKQIHTKEKARENEQEAQGSVFIHLYFHRKSSLYLPLGSVNLVLKVMGTPDEISSPPG